MLVQSLFALSLLALPAGAVATLQEESTSSALPPAVEQAIAADPLKVDPVVLQAVVRPLDLEQAEAELARWTGLLQEKCFEIRDVKLETHAAEEPEEVERLSEVAIELSSERSALIERTELVLDAVEKKGGDPSATRAYIDSLVELPEVSGWHATWSMAMAWVRSPEGGIALGLKVLRALGALVVAWVLSKLLAGLAQRMLRSMDSLSELLRSFLVASIGRATIVLGILVAIGQLGISISPFLAAIGAVGLVLGLALQGTLGNIASGIMIMLYRPFDVGDLISSAGSTGKVEGLNLMTTAIRTPDSQAIHIPNNMVWGDVITNVTASETRRVDLVVGIGYGDDVERAMVVLDEIVRAHEKVLAEPEPNIRVHELGESSVNLVVRPWAATADYWDVYWDITKAVKQRFDEEGISIPFPQRDVHVIPAASAQPEEAAQAGDHHTIVPRPSGQTTS